MPRQRIAIISKNARLCELVAAELTLLGYDVKTYDNANMLEGELYGIVSDNTDEIFFPNNETKIKLAIIGSQSRELPQGFTHILQFPFYLQDLRKIFSASYNLITSDTEEKRLIYADKENLIVRLENKIIKLSEYEFRILEILCRHSGECVSRASLNRLLSAEGGNISDVYICHLRKKLEAQNGIKIIYTVRQKGYMTHYKMK